MATSKTTTKKTTKKRTPAKKKASTSKTTLPSIKTFSAAVEYLQNQTNYERRRKVTYSKDTFKLDGMRKLLTALGNPQEKVAMIHVAGTNGKGSTVAMISSMLMGNGYTVGAYTSPHLIDIRERIVVNNEMIGEELFTSLIKDVVEAASELDFSPTFFELVTATAFKYFAEQAVDIAVIETGLGGRLDSTNVITPLMTLLTKIDLEHTHLLGDTVEDIAREKAGIFKASIPAISAAQSEEVTAVLRQCAEETKTSVNVIAQDIEFSARFGGGPDLSLIHI